MQLFSIIPRLPPLVDGIGDYALSLARLLREAVHVETHFIVTDPAWVGAKRIEDFAITQLSERTATELLHALPAGAETVFLHYEGYGYARRGCPRWLAQALAQWRGENSQCRLVTMFHELYAMGPPWTSSFWLSPVQKSLVTRLARLSDQWMTSLERYAEEVQQMAGKRPLGSYSLPVFSSIGEPAVLRPLAERRRRLVVFGTRGRRIEVYQRSSAHLNRICQRLGVTEILDIGRAVAFDFKSHLDVPVKTLGEMAGAEVSRQLEDAIAGVVDYPASMLGKSTIFAAYCSHGVIPILANYGDSTPAEGLAAGQHYWLREVEAEQLDLRAGQEIADQAFAWYQAHNLSAHANTLAAFFRSHRQLANEPAVSATGRESCRQALPNTGQTLN